MSNRAVIVRSGFFIALGRLPVLLLEVLGDDQAGVDKPGDVRHIVVLRHVNPGQSAHGKMENGPY